MPGARIGIDIGGTAIKLGLVRAGRVLERAVLPTRAGLGPGSAVRLIAAVANAWQSRTRVDALGAGVAGLIDHERGIVRIPPNLPGWDGLHLKSALGRATGLPVSVGNDVNAVVLGEYRFGAARGCQDVFGLTLGTGVGGGCIADGRLVLGANHAAGEIGHVSLNPRGPLCRCGKRGCLERYVGAQYIVARVRRAPAKARRAVLRQAGGELGRVTPRHIAHAARRGDRLAQAIFAEVGFYVGVAIANVLHLLDPETVVVGGGIAGAGPALWVPIRRTVRERLMLFPGRKWSVRRSRLGGDAGILGATLFPDLLR